MFATDFNISKTMQLSQQEKIVSYWYILEASGTGNFPMRVFYIVYLVSFSVLSLDSNNK